MDDRMNVLILNAGTRDTLVKYFRDLCRGKCRIVATDSFELASAIYEADSHYVTKRWDDTNYWDDIEKICDKEKIGLIFSLIDPELELLAGQSKRFGDKGILVNIGSEETVSVSFDKFRTLEFIKSKGYPWIKTFSDYDSAIDGINKGTITFPLIAKPNNGSGSAGLAIIDDETELKKIFQMGNMIVQEYMNGQEIGADVYVDLISNEVVSIFTKKKLKMRSGETDKSVSFKDERLFSLLSDFAKEFGLAGVNDIDVFEKDGEYYISEVNPRFGGGYLHAYESGVNFPKYLMNNMNGIVNAPEIGNYEEGIYMMKYYAVKIMTEKEIYDEK